MSETVEQKPAEGETTATLKYERPDPAVLSRAANVRLSTAQAMSITNDKELELAAAELREIKGAMDRLEERRMAITRPMDAAKKAVMDLFRQPMQALEQAESILKKGIGRYQLEQKRKAEEEQRRQAAAAAELRRQEAERADQLRREAEADAAAGNTAAAMEKQEAAAIAETVAQAMVAAAPPPVAVAKGVSSRAVWKGRVIDKAALVRHIAANPAGLLHVLDVNEGELNKLVNATKGAMPLPGVENYEDAITSARR